MLLLSASSRAAAESIVRRLLSATRDEPGAEARRAREATRELQRRTRAGDRAPKVVASTQYAAPRSQRSPFDALTRPSERVEPGQLTPDGELVNGLGAFVGDDALEIEHVADGYVLGADAGAAEHVAAVTGDIEGHATVVPLGKRYVRRLHGARVLQASELQRQQLRGGDAPGHVGEPHLDGLVCGQRPAEDRAGGGVIQQLPHARLRRPDDSPADSLSRLRKSGQRDLD